jgi:hypothetical protein
VVLTTMHLDQNPMNCEESNLLAACQKCHLLHDQPHHLEKALATTKHQGARVTDRETRTYGTRQEI